MIQVSSRLVYENRWLSLREDEIRLPDGSPGIYSVIDKPTCVLVVPMERGGCHLVEQFRYPIGRRSWEFPQGTWPDGRTAPTHELARAELREETGLRAGTLERIGRMAIAPGVSSQECDVYLATQLSQGPTAREHTEQGMVQRWFADDELTAMIQSGQIFDSVTLGAFALLDRLVPEFGRPKPESRSSPRGNMGTSTDAAQRASELRGGRSRTAHCGEVAREPWLRNHHLGDRHVLRRHRHRPRTLSVP